MTQSARLGQIVLDAADIGGLADFYAELTGWKVTGRDDDWIDMAIPDGPSLCFQLAPNHRPAQWPGQERPQQYHLDLLVADHEAAAAKAVELGATRLGDGPSGITLADPAGHTFDLCQRDGVDGVGFYAPTIDAPDAVALAKFYAELMGVEVAYEGPEGALISGDGKSVMFQQIEGYTAPSWPDPERPQQAHLDLFVDDAEEAEARALTLGATKLEGGGKTFRVYADPAGHPFCLCTG